MRKQRKEAVRSINTTGLIVTTALLTAKVAASLLNKSTSKGKTTKSSEPSKEQVSPILLSSFNLNN